MSGVMVTCPDCSGDGKETCHNPDHGFIGAMSWHDIGRVGCPVCGHHPQAKVGSKRADGGASCDTCNGVGKTEISVAREFCESVEYDFEDVMQRLGQTI